jgi:hypothetical protein
MRGFWLWAFGFRLWAFGFGLLVAVSDFKLALQGEVSGRRVKGLEVIVMLSEASMLSLAVTENIDPSLRSG